MFTDKILKEVIQERKAEARAQLAASGGPDLVDVDKTCPCCNKYYAVWDRRRCDGENIFGLHFTCVGLLPDGERCGSTMVFSTRSKAELRAELIRIRAEYKKQEGGV